MYVFVNDFIAHGSRRLSIHNSLHKQKNKMVKRRGIANGVMDFATEFLASQDKQEAQSPEHLAALNEIRMLMESYKQLNPDYVPQPVEKAQAKKKQANKSKAKTKGTQKKAVVKK